MYSAGSIVFCHLYDNNTGGSTNTDISATGWTSLGGVGAFSQNQRNLLAYRIMDGTEGDSVTFSFVGNSNTTRNRSSYVSIGFDGLLQEEGVDPFDGAAILNRGASGAETGISVAKTTTAQVEVLLFGVYATGNHQFVPSVVAGAAAVEEYDGGQFLERWVANAGENTYGGSFASTIGGSDTVSGYAYHLVALKVEPSGRVGCLGAAWPWQSLLRN
jgi:hypothetical protein